MHSEAVIVSTARTPIGKAGRGAFNDTQGVDLVAPLLKRVVAASKLDPAEVEEVVMGCAYPEGTTGGNIARTASLRAGFPAACAGLVVSRFCASGLEAVMYAARRITLDNVDVAIAGGVESISLVSPHVNRERLRDEWLLAHRPAIYMPMIETADIVADRYGIAREEQDRYSLESQRRTAAAQQSGIFSDEIVPTTTRKAVVNKETGVSSSEVVQLTADEGNRPETTYEALAKLTPVRIGHAVTSGNASQLSDGASVNLLMSMQEARRRDVEPLGIVRGFASYGCEPDEMGIGPALAVPRLLSRQGLSADDIDLWELNEAFASQVLYCRDRLGIPSDKLNVNGGAIAIGHPFGMSGSRMVGHICLEGRRRKAKYGVVTMCVAGGMGCAALIEFT